MRCDLSSDVVISRPGRLRDDFPIAIADTKDLRVHQLPRHVLDDPRLCYLPHDKLCLQFIKEPLLPPVHRTRLWRAPR